MLAKFIWVFKSRLNRIAFTFREPLIQRNFISNSASLYITLTGSLIPTIHIISQEVLLLHSIILQIRSIQLNRQPFHKRQLILHSNIALEICLLNIIVTRQISCRNRIVISITSRIYTGYRHSISRIGLQVRIWQQCLLENRSIRTYTCRSTWLILLGNITG